ncbi:hypothetical protein [Streptomyces sp. NPDC059564]|uniref:hypothetical protein n=1 Tax=Streptomyces sp. NPDC059564 TaxID=3346865 RepID=UPI0036BC78B6
MARCPRTSRSGRAASTARSSCPRHASARCGWTTARSPGSRRPACTPRATCTWRAAGWRAGSG